jgi:hypothetical protein
MGNNCPPGHHCHEYADIVYHQHLVNKLTTSRHNKTNVRHILATNNKSNRVLRHSRNYKPNTMLHTLLPYR